ncbi:hypothetical protein HMJ29_17355 [Hymenobacter taeanensis]|uniref:STAS/SEC14 domain-containing protein n=1 Tax=Hymenobacter taeanensis TaxID=2735321 RepID=A0A6M6BKU9_9BACT|nr:MULTISPECIES: hypothetical protein [Hymenobacter]QJX48589.1 hypothetical protein HMJ29_17355 [Hymenobacter taeanensis]UOQ81911.1 hypothetical protein MUN83_03735 [Hymenobacter sp. 5414T-23]
MPTELQNGFGDTYLIIEYDAVNHWVYNNWLGTQTYLQVTSGADACLNYLRDYKCPYLLNDNRHVIGAWDFAVDWVVSSWVPRAIEHGLTHMAHLFSPEGLATASAEFMYDGIGQDLQMRMFSDYEEARMWLTQSQERKV